MIKELQINESLEILRQLFLEKGWIEYIFGLLMFGSATMEGKSDYKDLDLLIILIDPNSSLPKELQSSANLRILLKDFYFPLPLHIFCHTKTEILKLCHFQNQLIGDILNFGKIIRFSGQFADNMKLEEFIKKGQNIALCQVQKKVNEQKRSTAGKLLVIPKRA